MSASAMGIFRFFVYLFLLLLSSASFAVKDRISSGNQHTCALDNTGVVCWGYNGSGQTDVPSLSNPTQVSSGYAHSCALDNTGVVCWGENWDNRTDVPLLSNPTQVSSGYEHTCALDNTGVVCWGHNGSGQTDVPSLSNPTQVSSGGYHTCALDNTGVVCWGANWDGQTDVPLLSNPTQVSSGGYHTCALDNTGVVCWGWNGDGQTDVPLLSNPRQVSSGGYHTCALDNTGVVCWGANWEGMTDVPSLSNPRQVSSGGYHTCALATSGVVCWGADWSNQTDVPELDMAHYWTNDSTTLPNSVDISIIEEMGFDQVIYTAQANESSVTYRIESKLAIQYADPFDIKIRPTFINDPENDGFYIMQLSLSESAINSMLPLANSDAKSIESFELTIGFDPDDIDIDSVNYIGPDFDSTFNISSSELLDDNSGIVLSQILIGPSMPVTSSRVIGSVKFKLKEGVDSAQFDINRFLINSELDNKTSSSVTLLTNLESDLLTINEISGEVSLSVVDYETHAQYSFEVIATDVEGNTSDKQAVIVRVIDIADVEPEITSVDEVSDIEENSGSNQVIYAALANTPMAIFRLVDGSDPALSINELTGQVTLADNPDFEGQSEYNFSVIASTSSGDSDPLVLTLKIINLDEIAPIFSESAAIAITINDYIGAGEVIHTAIATDSADVSDGFTFNLLGNDAFEFSISNDEATFGQVVLNNQLAAGQYSFEVVATDAVGNVSDAQTISLTVDSSVVITSPSYAGAIDENSATGQLVYTVTSSKEDVTYALTQDSDSDLFIDATTGEVFLLINPDYEVKNQYNFTVIATSIESGTSEQAVTLSINNLDEVGPTITSGSDAGLVVEGSSLEVVYTATADDNGDISAGVIFILSGDDAASFSINYLTGAVTFVGDADLDIQPTYSFNITAFDAAGNASIPVQVMLSVTPLEITSGDTAVFNPEEPGEIETVISVPDQAVNTQHVYVSDSQLSEDGSQVTVTLSYKADNPNTTGVGFTVNFDSGILSMNAVSEVFSGAIVSGVLHSDGNALDFGWASLFGQFPGFNEADLATITFDIDPSATDYAQLDLVRSSNDVRFEFDLQSQQIPLKPISQEIYQAEANTHGATFSLEDNTVYPLITESIITVPPLAPYTQYIYVSESARSEDGAQVTVTLSYMSDQANTIGVGFYLEFDSEVLELNNVSDVFSGAIATGNLNLEGNGLDFGWASLFGQFPGSNEVELATITFNVLDSNIHATELYISPVSTAAGFNFYGQPHEIVITGIAQPSKLSINENTGVVTLSNDADPYLNYSFTVTARNGDHTVSKDILVYTGFNYGYSLLDFDANGSVDALTDGLLLLRHTFNLRGETLTNGAIASNSSLSSAEVQQRVESSYAVADIDNNGNIDPLTDGLLLLRYLFGLRDESLVNGVISEDATRTDSSNIEAYIESYMP